MRVMFAQNKMTTNQNSGATLLSYLSWLESMEMRRSYYNMSGYTYPNQNPYTGMHYTPHQQVSHPDSAYYYQYYNNDPSQYNRKRQRRQAAAVVVESLWNNNNMGRKSTAQPRPKLIVPPRGIGPIVDPNENDVLCGRGGRINSHSGNIKFRDVINARKKEYLAPTTKKLEKAHIAAAIVYDIRAMDPPGRFLKEERDTGLWYDIGDAKAIKKTGQALREDAPDIRSELEGDSSGDEKGEKEETPTKEEMAEKAEKPKAPPKPKVATVPQSRSHESVAPAINSPRHVPGNWQQAHGVASMMIPQDYQAQASMPPPYAYHVNPYTQQAQIAQQQAFEGRTIPIQSPIPQSIYSLPSQFASSVKSVGRRVTHASRQAMDALSQSGGPSNEGQNEIPSDNVAFGRPFYPPTRTVMSSDNTMSTISGISDPISSTIGGSGLMSDFGKGSAISGMTGLSGLSGLGSSRSRGSFRGGSSSRTGGLGVSGMGRSSRSQFVDAMKTSKLSDLTASARSLGSIGRSLSFDNMTGVTDEAWRAIMEDDEMFYDGTRPDMSLLSGELASGRHSLSSGRALRRDSTAMSIASMSTGSSGRWLAGMKDTAMGDDGRSVFTEMSADLHALDLAHP